MTVFFLKAAVAPGFVLATSLVARRFGAHIGGVFGGLPMLAGPILLVLTLEQGRSFAAHAAAATLLGVVALAGFVISYAYASRRFGWAGGLAASWLTFVAAILSLRHVMLSPTLSLVCACGALLAALWLFPALTHESQQRLVGRYELALRAIATVLPIVAVTAVAPIVGSTYSGLLAAFPVMTPVLAAFTQARHGWPEAAALIRGFAIGFFAYAVFCFLVSILLERAGTSASFGLASGAALAVQAIVLALTSATDRSQRSQPTLEREAA